MIFPINLVQCEMELLHFKVFHTVCMHQFGWLLERRGNFSNLLQKEGGTQKGGGVLQKRGIPTLEETVGQCIYFWRLNFHHKDRADYSDRPSELCYLISNDLTQMVNFPTWTLDSDSQSCSFGFISSASSFYSTVVFPSLRNSDHVLIFPVNSKGYGPFQCTSYDYSCADWDGL